MRRTLIATGVLALLCASCARPYYHLPTAPPLAFVRADEALRRGQYKEAEKGFVDFLLDGTDRGYRPRAYYELAQAEYALGDYAAALDSLSELHREFPLNDWPQTSVLRGDATYALGNRVDAVLYWETAWLQLPAEERELLVPRLEKAIGESSEQERRSLDDLVIEPEIRAMLPGAAGVARAAPITRSGMGTAPVARSGTGTAPSDASKSRPPAETQAFQGDEQYAAGNRVDALLHWETAWVQGNEAERELLRPRMERAIDESSEGELELLGQLLTDPAVLAMLPAQALAAVPPANDAALEALPADAEAAEPLPASVRVAALLPLTGANRLQGRGSLRGLRLAFAEDPAVLSVRDTGSDAEMVSNLLVSLAAESEVVAAIGALDRAEAVAAATAAERLQLPLVLLSRYPGVGGRFVLQTGTSAEQKLRATVTYARQHLGAKRFAMLYPEDSVGRSFREPFRQEVVGLGGVVVGMSSYPSADGKPPTSIAAAQGWLRAGAVDVIFIPDSPPNAAAVAREVHRTAPAVLFLGTELWNDPTALAATGTALEGAIFADSFYAESALPSTQRFVDQFQSANSRLPTVLEAEAFDAAMLVRRAIGEGATTRQAVLDTLRATRGYEGGGRLSASADGPQRDLFLLRVRQGQVEEVTAVARN